MITECTACPARKGCMTEYVCHTTSIENARKILECGMEIWDAYYPDGTLVGCDLIRGEPIPNGLYHLVSEILVRHADGDYLLMQRDPRKPNYGGFFEATAGGSALKGEDAYCCAKRELHEETGIDAGTLTNIGRARGCIKSTTTNVAISSNR